MDEDIQYNTEGLPKSDNYYIDVFYNQDLGRVCYFAVNNKTNVPEVPFLIAADAKEILKDLEEMIGKPKGSTSKVTPLNTLKH